MTADLALPVLEIWLEYHQSLVAASRNGRSVTFSDQLGVADSPAHRWGPEGDAALPLQSEFEAASARAAPQQRRIVIASAFRLHGEKIPVAVLKAELLRQRSRAGTILGWQQGALRGRRKKIR